MIPKYKLEVVNANDIDDELIGAWRDLESRAIESNGFLSPHFVLPAIKHLEKTADVFGLFVSNISGGQSRLTGVGWF